MGTMKYHSGYTPDDTVHSQRIRFSKDKDTASVVPLFTPQGTLEAFVWPRHYMGQGAKPAYVTCGRLYGPKAPCPLCDAKVPVKQDWRVSMTVWDVKANERRYIDGMNMAGYRAMLRCIEAIVAAGGDPATTMFIITRIDSERKGQLSVVTMAAPQAAVKAAQAMVAFEPEEMVEEATPSARMADNSTAPDDAPDMDAPPPDDKDLPF